VISFALGSCIGSFLNVAIHRLPRGMSVHRPQRSFCPACGKPIAAWHNLPLLSWLLLRGKCGMCGAPIALRYPMVELLTAMLFVAAWMVLPPQAALFGWAFLAILVAITFIDAEHMIIPTGLTWLGTGLGLAAAAVWPRFPDLLSDQGRFPHSLLQSAIGWATGFLGLWAVVGLGKLAFGKKRLAFATAAEWSLREAPDDESPMCLVIDGEEFPWWDMFSRKTDAAILETKQLRVDGNEHPPGTVTIREADIELPDGTTRTIESLTSLSGTAVKAAIPREAMGFGDVHLLGMIGAFLGWPGVCFSLFSASIFAILWALPARIGFGRQLPFGPFLAMGAAAWLFGGWMLWEMYWQLITQPLPR
jgi:leader peptidase (prepilin peptidase)/N-methyltransferase